LLRIPAPRPGHYSTSLAIGPALPLGLGAALGSGEKTLVIHGDGGVMLNLAEPATAVETRATLVVGVFNNQGNGSLSALQDAYGTARFAVDLHTPDFIGLSHAMGMPATKVESIEQFEQGLHQALAADGPYLLEIDLSCFQPLSMFAR